MTGRPPPATELTAATGPTRRTLLGAAALGLATAGALGATPLPAFALDANLTVETLRAGVRKEMGAYRRYVAFSRRAAEEGYIGIAYLFTVLGTSEFIHAQNYNLVLTRLGAEIEEPPHVAVEVSDTKANLIAAAEAELNTIENVYPSALESAEIGGVNAAVENVRYAWESHKQHLEIIGKIQRWAPSFFERVARKIEDELRGFHVCRVCGSTVDKVPEDGCPICGHDAALYELIDPETMVR